MDAIHFLINVLFGLLAGWFTWWVLAEAGAPRPVLVLGSVVVGVLVFLANLASRFV